MKKNILPLLFVIWGVWGFCQNVDLIKRANLFDQNRGYVEEEEATGEEIDTEKEIKLPSGMPVLDGIVVIGNYKKAIFTYHSKEKKKKVSEYHGVGDKFGEAVLKEITPEYVVLLFDGKKYKLYPDTKLKAKKSSTNYSGVVKTERKTTAGRGNSKIISRTGSEKRGTTAKRKIPAPKPMKFDRHINQSKINPPKKNTKTPSARSNPFSGTSRPKPSTTGKKSGAKPNTRIKTPF